MSRATLSVPVPARWRALGEEARREVLERLAVVAQSRFQVRSVVLVDPEPRLIGTARDGVVRLYR